MKYWIPILAAAAIMALGAPAAFGTNANLPSDGGNGPIHLVKHTGGEQNLRGQKAAPATLVTRLQAQIRALVAKNKALAAKAKAASAEAKWQADRNLALANYIGELNQRLSKYEPTQQKPAVDDPDKDCTEYSVCTPEQDCRINGYGCADARSAPTPVDEVKQDDSSNAGAQATLESATYLDSSALYQDC